MQAARKAPPHFDFLGGSIDLSGRRGKGQRLTRKSFAHIAQKSPLGG